MKKLLFGLGLVAFLSIGAAQVAVPKLEKPTWFTASLGGVVNFARFNSNASLALTAGTDGAIQLWNTATGKTGLKIQASSSGVSSAFFSKDGSRILSNSSDDTTRLWNAKTGGLIQAIETGSGAAGFSPDGTRFTASAANQEDVLIFNAVTGKVLLTLKGHTDYVFEAEFSKDGSRLVTSSDDQTSRIWDTKTGKLVRSLKHTESVYAGVFIAGNSRVVTASSDEFVRIWDIASGKEVMKLKGHTNSVFTLAVSQDQSKFVSGSQDTTIRLWDAKSGKELRVFKGHQASLYALSFGATDQKIISASRDGTAKIWEVKTGKVLQNLIGHSFKTNSVVFSSDNKKILTSTGLQDVRIYSAEDGKEILSFEIDEPLNTADFSPDSTVFVTASEVHGDVWNSQTGELVTSLNGHDGEMESAIFSSDGQSILSVGADKTVRLWNATSGAEKLKLAHQVNIAAAVFSFDQKQIISLDETGKTIVWDAQTGKIINEIISPKADFYFSPRLIPFANNNMVLISNRIENSFLIWDLSGKLRLETQAEMLKPDMVHTVSADASMALVSLGSTAYVQEVATGKNLLELPNFDSRSQAVFSSNNEQLIVTSPKGVQSFQMPNGLVAGIKKLEVPAMIATVSNITPNLEARVTQILALSTKGALTGLQFLGLKRLIEEQKEPKELTDFLEQRLPEKDFLELVYAGFFERFNVPRGKP